MQRSTDFNDVLIVIVKGYDYRIYFCHMCKDEAMNKMENANLNEKIGLTDQCNKEKEIYIPYYEDQKYHRNQVLAKKYYQKNKKNLKEYEIVITKKVAKKRKTASFYKTFYNNSSGPSGEKN